MLFHNGFGYTYGTGYSYASMQVYIDILIVSAEVGGVCTGPIQDKMHDLHPAWPHFCIKLGIPTGHPSWVPHGAQFLPRSSPHETQAYAGTHSQP
jgi:hypothetical protein